MPPRSFRVVIANATQDLTLTQTFSHYCEGQWTGGWAPPTTIAPGQSGRMQSESGPNSFMTGTKAYVKYDVAQIDQFGANNRLGMIYVYWDNPWLGTTRAKYQSAFGDVYPDCDFTPPPSAFPPDTTSPVDFGFGFVSYGSSDAGGAVVRNVADVVGFTETSLTNIGVGIGYYVGLLGIIGHAELDLQVFDVAAPVGPTFGTGLELTESLKLLTSASLADWAGHWANGRSISTSG